MNGAHIHLVTNHIPVLGALASTAFVFWAGRKKDISLIKFSYQFIFLIGLLSLPAFFSGEPAEEVIEHLPGITESMIEAHEDFAKFALIATEVLAALAIYGLFLSRKNSESAIQFWKVIFIFSLINVALMMRTANLGGEIRHPEIRSDFKPILVAPAADHE